MNYFAPDPSDRAVLADQAQFLLPSVCYEKPRNQWFTAEQSAYTTMVWWPIAFHNNGKHLYLTSGSPRFLDEVDQRAMTFLRFQDYCRGGNHNGVYFRHLGHLCGLNGGPAQLDILISGLTIAITIPEHQMVWVCETPRSIRLYEHKKPLFLRNLERWW